MTSWKWFRFKLPFISIFCHHILPEKKIFSSDSFSINPRAITFLKPNKFKNASLSKHYFDSIACILKMFFRIQLCNWRLSKNKKYIFSMKMELYWNLRFIFLINFSLRKYCSIHSHSILSSTRRLEIYKNICSWFSIHPSKGLKK